TVSWSVFSLQPSACQERCKFIGRQSPLKLITFAFNNIQPSSLEVKMGNLENRSWEVVWPSFVPAVVQFRCCSGAL
ncbi:MAG TPA: hypothetical protein VMX16_20080, partial [Terriglobia bacterium]|nr:hypothetical protein [Terriglobia bacterium]